MKKIVFAVIGILWFIKVNSQTNTFPSSGNVGIGTTSPIYPFNIVTSTNDWSGSFLNTNNNSAFYFGHGGGYGAAVNSGTNTSAGTYAFFVTGPGTPPWFYVRGNGNVGIGTTSPVVPLHLVGNYYLNRPSAMIDGGSTLGGNVNFAPADFAVGKTGYISFYYPTPTKFMIATTIDGHYGEPYVYRDIVFGKQTNQDIDYMTIKDGGNIGIGTSTPGVKLEVKGLGSGSNLLANAASNISVVDENSYASNVGGGLLFGGGFTSEGAITTFGGIRGVKSNSTSGNYDGQLEFFTRSTGIDTWTNAQRMVITSNGNVGIGTTGSLSEKLTVNGNIKAKKITVTQSGWSDYVFYDNYRLRSLHDLEKFINTNKHLPDVPSAKEVEAKGVNVGDTQAVLLKKIEELTLYVIRQQKEIDQLKIILRRNQRVK